MSERRFVIRKYVMANSAKEAIRKERKCDVDEVFVDDKQPERTTSSAVGFTVPLDKFWREDEIRAKRRKV